MSNQPSVQERIREARRIWDKHGSLLMDDPDICAGLRDLKEAIEGNWKLMRALRVVEGCGICATEISGGGCCGSGIEEWYDGYVLLMNLMLGNGIPQKRINDTSCLFLGPSGCLLKARFHFCINYLCHHIRERLDDEAMRLLSAGNGREIYCGYVLENIIREKLATLTTVQPAF